MPQSTPSCHSLYSSSTNGAKNELMLFRSLLGPGMIPTRKMFCRLKRSLLGKFIRTRYSTPTEYGVWSKGCIQSTFSIKP